MSMTRRHVSLGRAPRDAEWRVARDTQLSIYLSIGLWDSAKPQNILLLRAPWHCHYSRPPSRPRASGGLEHHILARFAIGPALLLDDEAPPLCPR
eukprot:scaffold19184_cov75-Phaeocystis_antarctica.AAC.1